VDESQSGHNPRGVKRVLVVLVSFALAIAGPAGGGQAPRLTVSANVAARGDVLLARIAGLGAKKMLHSAVVVRAPARRPPI
jgi:hypothetical protein